MIVCIGVTCLDIVQTISSFPEADAKIRANSTLFTVGGNCANVCQILASLFQQACRLLSKIYPESHIGAMIIKELCKLNLLDLSCLHLAQLPANEHHHGSGFTTIWVDEAQQTRTCVHSAIFESFVLANVNVPTALPTNTSVIYSDSRYYEVALACLKYGNTHLQEATNLLECERIRHKQDYDEALQMLAEAHVLVCSKTFAAQFATFHGSTNDANFCMFHLWNCMKQKRTNSYIVTTLGSKGCIAITKNFEQQVPNATCDSLQQLVTSEAMTSTIVHRILHHQGEVYDAYYCPSYPIEQVVDTTAAGDTFIASVAFCLHQQYDLPLTLQLACYVAGIKCTAMGKELFLSKQVTWEHVKSKFNL